MRRALAPWGILCAALLLAPLGSRQILGVVVASAGALALAGLVSLRSKQA